MVWFTKNVREAFAENGWATLTLPKREELLAVAQELGHPVPSRAGGPITDLLHPKRKDEAHPRSMSAVYGEESFPWHTDGAHHRIPPKYALFRSLSECHVAPTELLDSRRLGLTPSEQNALARQVWRVEGGGTTFLSPIINLSLVAGTLIFRYNPCCMRPAADLNCLSSRLMERFEHSHDGLALEWQPEICVVVDNWRMAHRRPRTSVTDAGERRLQRILVSEVIHP